MTVTDPRKKHSPTNDHVADEQSVVDAAKLKSRLIYEVIRRDGEEEMLRPTNSIVFSGFAAGLLISFSVIGEAVLRQRLPDAEWAFLIENLGYSMGFLLVILGGMQLFTENTISTVLPIAAAPNLRDIKKMLIFWGTVLLANIAGAFAAAAFIAFSGAFDLSLLETINELSKHAVGFAPWEGFVRAIPAGVLIAAIVWMLPNSVGNEFMVILFFTWLIAVGDFTHIIAGSVEMAVLIVQGSLPFDQAILQFFIPVLAGNIIGGTFVFTMIAWGQVKEEVV